MMWPPIGMCFRIGGKGGGGFGIWLPLFVLWPAACLLAIFVVPCLMILRVVCWRGMALRAAIFLPGRLLAVLCALRGLRLDIRGNARSVYISFQ